jgi:trk system potassium uptake protein TrkA
VVQADLSDEVTLKTLGLGNFDVVVVAMGEEFEASQIATMVALEQGVQHIIVKALTKRQKKILEKLGITDIILPEHEMGVKTALKLIGSNIIDIFGDSDLYTLSEMKPLDRWIGKSIEASDIRKRHGLIILAVRRREKLTAPVSPDWIISSEDVLIAFKENNH